MRRLAFNLVLLLAAFAALATAGLAIDTATAHTDEPHVDKPAAEGADHQPIDVRLVYPKMDSTKGMRLFIRKGCVACHAVNGVGGHDASPLDAHTMEPEMSPFELAAKMWAMASYMISAQEEALGYQILFSGEELAHIVAFLHDDKQQHALSEDSIPPNIRKMMDHEHKAPGGGIEEHAPEIGHGHDKSHND